MADREHKPISLEKGEIRKKGDDAQSGNHWVNENETAPEVDQKNSENLETSETSVWNLIHNERKENKN